MALSSQSLFLYGLQVTEQNRSIDFVNTSGGPTIMATLNLGFYSGTTLVDEIERAMYAADPTNIYTASLDRTVSGGLQNRLTISTSGSFLSLLFGSGPRVASSAATLIGFGLIDQTGATSYQGSTTIGTSLVPDLYGYTYLPPENYRKVFGSVNVSASGVKEAVVFQIQEFVQVNFMYEPKNKISPYWKPLIDWMIQQQPFEFTPEVSSPTVFYNVTLEKSEADGKGMALTMKEQLPKFPNFYTTGLLTMRLVPT